MSLCSGATQHPKADHQADMLTQDSHCSGLEHQALVLGSCLHDDAVRGRVQLVVDAVPLAEGHG